MNPPGLTNPQQSPHPVLADYYQRSDERQAVVDGMFDDVARHYDRITGLMSFGTGQRYRRDVLKRVGVRAGHRVLDVACGTGQVGAAAVGLVGAQGSVVGVDPSAGMRAVAQGRRGLTVLEGKADALPVDANSVDFVTIGYALRHVSDLISAFAECRRVLRPGGKLVVLEITAPERGLTRSVLKAYLKGVVPTLSHLVTANREAKRLMSYYWDTIDQCVRPQTILKAMADAGLKDPAQQVTLGIFREYTADR